MRLYLLAALCAVGCTTTEAAKLPSYIKQCSFSNPAFNDCLLKSTQEAIPILAKGEPSLKLPVLDPLVIEKLVVEDSHNQAIGLNFTCEKCSVTGVKSLHMKSMRMDAKNKRLDMKLSFPQLQVKGKYTVSGKVLILPIRGSGDADLVIRNDRVTVKGFYDIEKRKDNKEYLKIKTIKIESNVGDIDIHLTNLFNGDKTLGDNMNRFLNENWREFQNLVTPAVDEVVSQLVMNLVNILIGDVPYNDIFIQ